MADQTYLGTGMKFPPQINPATGRFMTVSEEESVKESIYLILMTQQSERFMRQEFGSHIMQYPFIDTNQTTLSMVSREIQNDILSNEPRVSDVDVRLEPMGQAGSLLVYIDYELSSSHQTGSMVFPYYMSAEPSEESESYETMEPIEIE